MYDFANLLFSGSGDRPCNARCPFCIGQQIDPARQPDNLNLYPLRNLDQFIELIRAHGIRQVAFTGTNTDPQLYRHEARLIADFRRALPEAQLSLHTNGRLALRKLETFNQYDRVSLSLPSFDPPVYRQMMGVTGPPDLPAILRQARIPVKISCVVTDKNAPGMEAFLENCRALGIRRVVLRKLVGERRTWQSLLPQWERLPFERCASFHGNPVYDCAGMEVTWWDFACTQAEAINLFSSGEISTAYLLSQGR